ncbi:M23 family metallopeptidase [Nocardia sp. CDC159]|uniref:M23 family metallopeptidase n=1 Tax=Nocardia pulmonis TaxID=2951408 RepID=A0A9X2IW57_9NOCA|nr:MULTISPECIES: M23 family metallopeptidase [Nocardia]MCM6773199.1 M23 family metallopeptidase [Nocardia pulmonis]MCM6785498.1 M23 family metallopeptidase [Nocardia sp. CDC159]
MPHHRETSTSVSVWDLLGDGAAARPTRHRSQARTGDRMKLAASAAVAAGALIGTASQLAHAAPLLPGGNDNESDPVTLEVASEPIKEAKQTEAKQSGLALVAESAPVAPELTPAAAPAPIAAPFGLQNLPPEVAGPLAQAEQVIKNLQQQAAPPAAVRPVAGAVSSGFGSRWGAFHYGVDFADSLGQPIHSVSSGTVIEAGPAAGFGLWVRVKHDDGTTGVYGHVNDILTHVGKRVNAGDVIATVGNRGNSTGPHLHLEIWDANDVRIDPTPYLASRGVLLHQQWGPQD